MLVQNGLDFGLFLLELLLFFFFDVVEVILVVFHAVFFVHDLLLEGNNYKLHKLLLLALRHIGKQPKSLLAQQERPDKLGRLSLKDEVPEQNKEDRLFPHAS